MGLYQYAPSEYAGMVQEDAETLHVTPTWAVAASTEALVKQVVARLERAGWPSTGESSPIPEKSWDVFDGTHYAAVTKCSHGDDGEPYAKVTLKNGSMKTKQITGMLEILDAATGELHDYAFFRAPGVPPGEIVSTEAYAFEGVPQHFICVASSVGESE